MEIVFTIWIVGVIAVLVIFMIGLLVDQWLRSRRGKTEADRAHAKMMLRRFVGSASLLAGLNLGYHNIRALIDFSPYDPVPVWAHIGLALVGVSLLIAAIVMAVRDQAQAHQKS